jgi:hypothetical protein
MGKKDKDEKAADKAARELAKDLERIEAAAKAAEKRQAEWDEARKKQQGGT